MKRLLLPGFDSRVHAGGSRAEGDRSALRSSLRRLPDNVLGGLLGRPAISVQGEGLIRRNHSGEGVPRQGLETDRRGSKLGSDGRNQRFREVALKRAGEAVGRLSLMVRSSLSRGTLVSPSASTAACARASWPLRWADCRDGLRADLGDRRARHRRGPYGERRGEAVLTALDPRNGRAGQPRSLGEAVLGLAQVAVGAGSVWVANAARHHHRPRPRLRHDRGADPSAPGPLTCPGSGRPGGLLLLEMASCQLALARAARARVAAEGMILTGPRGGRVPHPLLAVERRAAAELRRTLALMLPRRPPGRPLGAVSAPDRGAEPPRVTQVR